MVDLATTWSFLKDNKDAFLSIGSVFSSAATVLAILIFSFGLRQYAKAESWKKTEFLAKLYDEFANDRGCRNTMSMLDGDARTLYFDKGDKFHPVKVDINVVYRALRPFNPGDDFTEDELRVRDTFDRFFVYLEQFDRAIDNRLVRAREVYPYFGYWIELLNGDDTVRANNIDRVGGPLKLTSDGEIPDELRRQIHRYIDDAGFEHVQRFLKRYPNGVSSTTSVSRAWQRLRPIRGIRGVTGSNNIRIRRSSIS
jgi:hypothetical protein